MYLIKNLEESFDIDHEFKQIELYDKTVIIELIKKGMSRQQAIMNYLETLQKLPNELDCLNVDQYFKKKLYECRINKYFVSYSEEVSF